MTIESAVTRRTLLVAGAGVSGAAVLAACSSGSSPEQAAPSSRSSTAPPTSAAPSSSAAASDAASSSSVAGTTLATLADISVGEAVSVTLPDGKPGIVSRPTTTTAACFSAICTHQGCTVKPAGTKLDCPCHGSVYDAITGTVLSGPAPSPLPRFAVQVDEGRVVLDG